jgi:hypothetical protein
LRCIALHPLAGRTALTRQCVQIHRTTALQPLDVEAGPTLPQAGESPVPHSFHPPHWRSHQCGDNDSARSPLAKRSVPFLRSCRPSQSTAQDFVSQLDPHGSVHNPAHAGVELEPLDCLFSKSPAHPHQRMEPLFRIAGDVAVLSGRGRNRCRAGRGKRTCWWRRETAAPADSVIVEAQLEHTKCCPRRVRSLS